MRCRAARRLCELSMHALPVKELNQDWGTLPFVRCSAGIEQSEDMKRFLWYVHCILSRGVSMNKRWLCARNNHFAAIASDQPAMEVRPIDLTYMATSVASKLYVLLSTSWSR